MDVEEPMDIERKTPQQVNKVAGAGGTGKARKKAPTKKKKSLKRKKIETNLDTSVQEADEYAVEKIVDKKIVDGEAQYFIKWQGWGEESNTWEPIEHLGNCHLMIEAYENRLASAAKKKQSSKRGRSGSVTSSVTRGTPSSTRAGQRNRREDPIEEFSESEDDYSGVEDGDQDLTFGILHECPKNKELEKIHAVAVVDGYLTFLVQWKTEEQDGRRPPICDTNANMVRATSMNEKFPQEVINFYQSRVRFNLAIEAREKQVLKAGRALAAAEERRCVLKLKRGIDPDVDDETEVDPAIKAIEKARREFDPFDPNDSNLSSSESDDDDELDTPQEED